MSEDIVHRLRQRASWAPSYDFATNLRDSALVTEAADAIATRDATIAALTRERDSSRELAAAIDRDRKQAHAALALALEREKQAEAERDRWARTIAEAVDVLTRAGVKTDSAKLCDWVGALLAERDLARDERDSLRLEIGVHINRHAAHENASRRLRAAEAERDRLAAELRELQHAVWHALDNGEERDVGTLLSAEDYVKLSGLVPEEHP